MKLPEIFRTQAWRPVAGLMLAGLLGWLAAWFLIPNGPAGGQATQAAAPPPAAAARKPDEPRSAQALEQLTRSQSKVSEGAARVVAGAQPQVRAASAAASPVPAPKQSAAEIARSKKREAMLELQSTALAEIRAVPPGDTKKLIAALERFDAKMRAAGAPSIIDIDKMRKAMEGMGRVQELNRQLIAETEKGRNSDPNKIQSLGSQILAAQKEMPQQFIKLDVLQQRTVQ